MNALENYIVAIHSVTPYKAEWTKEFNKDFVEVEITSECYGRENKGKYIFNTVEWEKIKEQGYYMA